MKWNLNKFRIVKIVCSGAIVKYSIQLRGGGWPIYIWLDLDARFDNLLEAEKRVWDLKRTDIDVYKFNQTINE